MRHMSKRFVGKYSGQYLDESYDWMSVALRLAMALDDVLVGMIPFKPHFLR